MIDLFTPEFAADIWAKNAGELAISNVPFSDKDVLDALLQYSTRPVELRSANPLSEAVTALNGSRTRETFGDLMVAEEDATVDDYANRVEKRVGSDEWSVAYFGLYAASPAMWDAAKVFADELASSIGYRPGGRVDIDCFVGRYSSTHTGVHVDYAHNFAYTLRDGKTMFTWPPDQSHLMGLQSPDYDQFKSDGLPLENRTDRIAYFPQDHLHVAESKAGVSLNVNITFWESGDDANPHAEYVKALLRGRSREGWDRVSSGSVGLLPENELLLATMRSLVEDGSLRKRMAVAQLISDTSSRLNVGRPLVNPTTIENVVAINAKSTAQWMTLGGLDHLLLAANGHCTELPYSHALADLLNRLADGHEMDISHVDNDLGNEVSRDIRKAISALARWGAI